MAINNQTADSISTIAMKAWIRRRRHLGGGWFASGVLFFMPWRFKPSSEWWLEWEENRRENKERSDIRIVLINKGFDHSKVYNTLTVQFEWICRWMSVTHTIKWSWFIWVYLWLNQKTPVLFTVFVPIYVFCAVYLLFLLSLTTLLLTKEVKSYHHVWRHS